MNRPARKFDTWVARVLPVVWLGSAIVAGATLGAGPFFLAFAGGALVLAIWLFWQSTQGLTADTPLTLEEALGMAAPTLEEERKESVLRILKDLEYERAVGKIEDADYRELSERYRAEARALLSELEEGLGPARRRAEALFEKRLGKEGPRADAPGDEAPRDETPGDDAPATEVAASETTTDDPPEAAAAANPSEPPHDAETNAGAETSSTSESRPNQERSAKEEA